MGENKFFNGQSNIFLCSPDLFRKREVRSQQNGFTVRKVMIEKSNQPTNRTRKRLNRGK